MREKQLKNWRRDRKVNVIEAGDPAWRDLALDYGIAVMVPKPWT